jgi:hypothetical protein
MIDKITRWPYGVVEVQMHQLPPLPSLLSCTSANTAIYATAALAGDASAEYEEIASGYEEVMFGPVGSSTNVTSLVEGKARAASRAAGRANVLKASSVYENVVHRASLASISAVGGGGGGGGADIYDFSTGGSHAGGAASRAGGGAVGYEQAVSTQPAFYDSLNDQAEKAAGGVVGGSSSNA